MVDISYEHYAALRELLSDRTMPGYTRSPTDWAELDEKRQKTIMAGLIQEATIRFGEDYKKLMPSMPNMSFEAAGDLYARGAHDAPALYLVMAHDDWYKLDLDERRGLMQRWFADALENEKANTPESEVTPW